MRSTSLLLLLPIALGLGCSGDKAGDTAPSGATDGADGADGADGTDGTAESTPVVVVTGAVSLAPGETAQLTAATVNGDDDSYTWSSSQDAVATIDGDGWLTAVHDGEATLTATGDQTGAAGSVQIWVSAEVPFYDAWVGSAHAARDDEAFRHWDDDGAVPASCARCHSKGGFLDFLGADGSAQGSVEADHATSTVIDCETCHNSAADALDAVTFPSGVTVDGLGEAARCATCHQGRSSGADVDAAIDDAGLTDTPDATSDALGFENIHYYPAAATLFAGQVAGGYQYAGQVYDWRFRHVEGVDSCTDCHDPHSLEVRVESCGECHTGVASSEDLQGIRMVASAGRDYDGDGNTTEGIYHEIRGLRGALLQGIQALTLDQGLGAICYSATAYPYWFADTDSSGDCSDDEAAYANAWGAWTPRLMRATYNYQMATKDPGSFAHNAKYTIQLLHDALQDVNGAQTSPADLSALDRDDPGHFNGAGEAARHWDDDATVSSSCSKCHGGAEGLHFYLDYGVSSRSTAPDNGLECETCHDAIPGFSLVEVDSVAYPSGVEIERPADPSNLCSTCHSGRNSGADVDASIASGRLRFINVHYAPAGAVIEGADAAVGYEYSGQTYAGPWGPHSGGSSCVDCHDAANTDHSFAPQDNFSYCTVCHTTATSLGDIRNVHSQDHDGDGDPAEPLADELGTLQAALLSALQASATGTPPCYNPDRYPYWFEDTDSSGGVCDSGETTSYSGWTPAQMKAAFNYQLARKDAGAWAHNFDYTAQLLIDSIEDLGGDVSGYVRP